MPRKIAAQIANTIVVFVCLVGCEMSQSQQYQLASNTYTAAVASMTAASITGDVSLDDLERFNIVRVQAEEMLGQWGAAIAAGQEFDGALQFQMLLNRLLTIRLELEVIDGRGSGDTTGLESRPGWHRSIGEPGERRAA